MLFGRFARLLILCLSTVVTCMSVSGQWDTFRVDDRHGRLMYMEVREDGSDITEVVEFSRTGQLKTRYFRKNILKKQRRNTTVYRSILDSTYTSYSGGLPRIVVQMKNNKSHGEMVIFRYGTRDTEQVFLYQRGKEVGMLRNYYNSGKPRMVFQYSHDSLVNAISYDTAGRVICANTIQQGNGYFTFCSEDGTLCCRCEVIAGKRRKCGPLDARKRK